MTHQTANEQDQKFIQEVLSERNGWSITNDTPTHSGGRRVNAVRLNSDENMECITELTKTAQGEWEPPFTKDCFALPFVY